MRFFLLLTVALCACNRQPQNAGNTTALADQTSAGSEAVPADFITFYEKFHQDSQYQIAHISWPLQGDKVQDRDTLQRVQEVRWDLEHWRMHRANFNANDYRIEREMIGDVMVVERVMAKAVNYGIERRFAKQPNGDWELIFYSDMRER